MKAKVLYINKYHFMIFRVETQFEAFETSPKE